MDLLRLSSVGDFACEHASLNPAETGSETGSENGAERPALIFPDCTLSFRELWALVEPRVAELRAYWKEERTPVTMVAEPQLDSLVTVYAALEAQVPLALLHPRLVLRICHGHLRP